MLRAATAVALIAAACGAPRTDGDRKDHDAAPPVVAPPPVVAAPGEPRRWIAGDLHQHLLSLRPWTRGASKGAVFTAWRSGIHRLSVAKLAPRPAARRAKRARGLPATTEPRAIVAHDIDGHRKQRALPCS